MSAVRAGRRAAEARMADVFAAYAPNGTTTNGAGFEGPAFTPMGSTPARSKGQKAHDTATRMLSIGGRDAPIVEGGLSIPVDAYVTADGLGIIASERRGVAWEFQCVSVGPDTDAALVGSRWMVTNAPIESNATARRLDIVRLT